MPRRWSMDSRAAQICRTMLAAAALLLGLAPLAVAQSSLIAEVRVEGAGYVSADSVLDVVKAVLKPGVELTPELSAEAEKLIMLEGYYERVTVSKRVVAEGLQVIISVIEKQRIEKILFVGNTVIADEQLSGVVKSRVGGFARPRLAKDDAGRIEEHYAKAGYFAVVTRADIDEFGVLTVVIEEGRVEDITITGLRRTKRWVVERQIRLKPGELYNERQIALARDRIFALNIFKNVTAVPLPGKLDPVKGIIVENKGGRSALLGRVVVDATGDADVAARAGAPFILRPVEERWAPGMMSLMCNVDLARTFQYLKDHPDEYIGEVPLEELEGMVKGDYQTLGGFMQLPLPSHSPTGFLQSSPLGHAAWSKQTQAGSSQMHVPA